MEQAPEMTFEIDYRARIDRYTRHGVDQQRSAQEARLVTADLKPKISLFYKIAPDDSENMLPVFSQDIQKPDNQFAYRYGITKSSSEFYRRRSSLAQWRKATCNWLVRFVSPVGLLAITLPTDFCRYVILLRSITSVISGAVATDSSSLVSVDFVPPPSLPQLLPPPLLITPPPPSRPPLHLHKHRRGGRDMMSGDCGGRENDGGDEKISSSDGDNDMLEGNEEKKMTEEKNSEDATKKHKKLREEKSGEENAE
ncbi:hypothetical protein YC2023_098408 [Brassica napus]